LAGIDPDLHVVGNYIDSSGTGHPLVWDQNVPDFSIMGIRKLAMDTSIGVRVGSLEPA
jgi:hypothetical protein